MRSMQAHVKIIGRHDSLRTRIFRSYHVWLPCLIVLAVDAPLLQCQLPNSADVLTESYEPLKTLKFFSKKGQVSHKWGPAPNFIYAPIYAPCLAYWAVRGDFGRPEEEFPYGFQRLHEQFGTLIFLARFAGMALGIVMLAWLAIALGHATGSRPAAFLAVTLCVATGPGILQSLVVTKPDGLMLAFLFGAMAIFSQIARDGLTMRRGLLLSTCAVLSISCKMQTVPAFLAIYLAIGAREWLATKADAAAFRGFLRSYLGAIACGVILYLTLNVAYAPQFWVHHIRFWFSGPGIDPNVWAPSNYSTWSYIRDTLRAIRVNLGFAGIVAMLLAIGANCFGKPRSSWFAWIPPFGYVSLIVAKSGYMPDYFMLPLGALLTLPVAQLMDSSRGPQWVRRIVVAALCALVCLNLWSAALVRYDVTNNPEVVTEYYVRQHCTNDQLIHLGNVWPRHQRAHRLSYLGYKIDDRGIGSVLRNEPPNPDLILIAEPRLRWLQQCGALPARNAMVESEVGFSFAGFTGLEDHAYELVERLWTKPPSFFNPDWLPDRREYSSASVLVYRKRVAGSDGQ
jgi:hypothetical protein